MSSMTKKLQEQLVYYNKIVGIAVFFIALGTVFYHYVEKLTWLDSVYFTVITLATVGYGDIVPKTPAGKLFTIFYVIIGITIFIALARMIITKLAYRRLTHAERRSAKK